MGRCLFDLLAAATLSGMVVIVAPTQAQTQSNLSEKLSNTMMGARRPEPTSKLDESTKLYDEALTQSADLTPQKRRMALKGRASVFEMAKEFDRAEADLTTALKIEPLETNDYVDRGYFYLRRSRYAEAMQDFLAGARQDPKGARFRYGAGRVHANMRNYPAAIELYSEAIRLNPKDGVSFLSRAEANLNLKKLAEAKTDYDRAIKLGLKRGSDKYFGFFGRGYVNLILEDYAAAVADFDAALEVEPQSLNVWVCRGIANERRGRTELAINDFEHAYVIDASNGVVTSNLRRLRSREPLTAMIPAFQIDENQRLANDGPAGLLPKRPANFMR